MTLRELINRSLRLLSVIQAGETPAESETSDAIPAVNGMLEAWRTMGIDLEFLPFTTLDDVIPYPEDHLSAFAYNLAIELAPEYGVEPSTAVGARAGSYFRALQAQYADPDILTIDPQLTPGYNTNSWFL